MRKFSWSIFGSAVAVLGLFPCFSHLIAGEIDLKKAVVVTPNNLNKPETRAVEMLVDEVRKRTWIRWDVSHTWPSTDNVPVIAIGPAASLDAFAGKFATDLNTNGARPAEGYHLAVKIQERAAPAVFVIGNDSRGVLFGVGRFLREMQMSRYKVFLTDNLDVTTAPRYPLRGHQLGYRPKTNSYDGWDLPQWEQYFRDLAVFGTNAVELIPPRSDDAADSPHFPRPPMEMMIGMSKLLDDYGLDVWIWYPAMDRDYSNPKTVAAAIKEWGEVFKKLPRIDAIFVPGGDPGHTRPMHLMALLEKQTENLHRYHPKAQMWVSPQGFTQQWLDEFYEILKKDQPAWLSGIVHGPQVRVSLPQLRSAIPAKYPIRRYPDITHSMRCQYGVPDWDLAYACTEAREVINPRPIDEAAIFHAFKDSAIGFLTYSEGCNDDVNKIIWSGLGWDPDAKPIDILREYSRYFIGERHAEDFAQGLMSLERNWRGPLLSNESVYATLGQFQALEKTARPADNLNWRFQQALYRAYYDAYERKRLLHETDLEERALAKLRLARQIGTLVAMSQAEAILDRSEKEKVATDWRARIFELGEALFQSIRMQLSAPRYQAERGRGNTLDTLDEPLNNRFWMRAQFAMLKQLASEIERLEGINRIIHWTDPGPGGFYDDLGNPTRQPHLVTGLPYAKDPARLQSALTGFNFVRGWRLSWCTHAESLFETPLRMRYTDLDRNAQYRVRMVYAGENFAAQIRLLANDTTEIHPLMKKPVPIKPVEFDIPKAATANGSLTLTWNQKPGGGGGGRGCQVAEVWLLKKPE